SLGDDPFLRALDHICASVQRQSAGVDELTLTQPQWYALLPHSPDLRRMDTMQRKMKTSKIRPIWYECTSNDHAAILQVLNMMKSRVESKVNSLDERPDSLLRAREARRLAELSA